MKIAIRMARRQPTGLVESLVRQVGLDWTVPDVSTLFLRQKALAVNIPYRGSKEPLHMLIDSPDIEGEGERHARKHAESQKAGLVQDSSWDRRGDAGGPRSRGHREPHPRCTGSTRPAQPDPSGPADRQRHRIRHLRYTKMPRRHC